jgi:hypothetical protein
MWTALPMLSFDWVMRSAILLSNHNYTTNPGVWSD